MAILFKSLEKKILALLILALFLVAPVAQVQAAWGAYDPAYAGFFRTVRASIVDKRAQSFEQNLMKHAGSKKGLGGSAMALTQGLVQTIGRTAKLQPFVQQLAQQNLGKLNGFFKGLSGFTGGFGGVPFVGGALVLDEDSTGNPFAMLPSHKGTGEMCPISMQSPKQIDPSAKLKATPILYATSISGGAGSALLARDPKDKTPTNDGEGENGQEDRNYSEPPKLQDDPEL